MTNIRSLIKDCIVENPKSGPLMNNIGIQVFVGSQAVKMLK